MLYCGVHVWCVVLNRFHHSICVIILKWVMWWHAKCFGHTRDVAWRGEIDWRQPGRQLDSWTARTASQTTARTASTVRTVWWQQPFFLYTTSCLFVAVVFLLHHHKRLCTFTYYCITCNNNYITLSYIYIHRSVKQNKFIYIDAFKLEYGKLFNISIDLYT